MNHRQEVAIAGLIFEPRKVLGDDRGAVLHHLSTGSPFLPQFGEVYMSTIWYGAVKAWKRHHRVAQNISVPIGTIRFVAYDSRSGSPTSGAVAELVLERHKHGLLHIPAGIWYGFRGEVSGESLIVNCVSEPHDPNEIDRLPESSAEVPYSWNTR